ncbi:DUF6915 family protein [Bradyrhizobium sp. HKCCYLR20261]|uniref:DUF6915 family protein n=1 Tax=unclassified Bradyrhizobium TaxID=2631580 RepID=UPI003EBF72FC
MQPWRHAELTARPRGADWLDDLSIHEFVDSTKTACPDLRHRIVLHNSDLGVVLTERAFPERADCADIVREHVRQDLGSVPTLADWMTTAQRPSRVRWREPDDQDVISEACDKLGLLDDTLVRQVLGILTAATPFVQGHEDFGRAILMNNFGPSLVRRLLGPPRAIHAPGRKDVIFDASWVAEGIITANFGRIPLLGDILVPFSGQYPK